MSASGTMGSRSDNGLLGQVSVDADIVEASQAESKDYRGRVKYAVGYFHVRLFRQTGI